MKRFQKSQTWPRYLYFEAVHACLLVLYQTLARLLASQACKPFVSVTAFGELQARWRGKCGSRDML